MRVSRGQTVGLSMPKASEGFLAGATCLTQFSKTPLWLLGRKWIVGDMDGSRKTS